MWEMVGTARKYQKDKYAPYELYFVWYRPCDKTWTAKTTAESPDFRDTICPRLEVLLQSMDLELLTYKGIY